MKFSCGCEFDKLDFDNLNLECSSTWELIGDGLTKGLFQIEGSLGKRYCKSIKPRNIEELAAVISLIRPGCLEAEYREHEGKMLSITDTYVKTKRGDIAPEYIDPTLEPILKATFGVPVYQEQIMRICTDFAGFTLQESDKMRKAVGKKQDEEVFAKLQDMFVESAISNSHDKDLSETIFGWIKKFSGYGFNRCVAGNTLLDRGTRNQHSSGMYTVEHLYSLVNDYEYARDTKQIPLREKLRNQGYGNCMAVCKDGKVRPMPIKTIHKNGKKKIVKVTDNAGRVIFCTLNHKFMTTSGDMKPIGEVGVGGRVICHLSWYDDEKIYDHSVHKIVNKGDDGLVDALGKKKRFDRGHRIGSATILSIEEIPEEIETYDVEMDTEEHNWIANGFAVSNSHAVGYAFIGYWGAYAKVHFPLEFFKNKLTFSDSNPDAFDEIKQLVHEAKLFDINISPPSIEEMNVQFKYLGDNTIMFGLAHIKGVGESSLKEVKKLGSIKNEAELFRKIFVDGIKVKKNVVESLIKSGAIPSVRNRRVKTLARYMFIEKLTARERALLYDEEMMDGEPTITAMIGALENFGITRGDKRLIKIKCNFEEIKIALGGNPTKMALAWEKFHLGMPLSGSEVELYSNYKVNTTCRDFLKIRDKSSVCMGVIIESVKVIKDKKGNQMCFMSLSDNTYMIDSAVVFSRAYKDCSWIIEEGKPVLVSGRKDNTSLFVNKIEHL